MKQTIIISRLLDKYENSKHLSEPGVSNKRVMLRIGPGKKEFPEYDYENASVRDAYNDAAKVLETEGLITTQWVKGRPVLSSVILQLPNVMNAYRRIGREHPGEMARKVAELLEERLADISTEWIVDWKQEVCREARTEFRVPQYCKKDRAILDDLLTAFCMYDALAGESVTMRAFSSRCYHDTKYFERNIRELFLRVAMKYDTELAQIHKRDPLGIREQLAYLGIYARPELYELAGNGCIQTAYGMIALSAAGPCGIALPSTIIDQITSIDLSEIRKVVFIENKTNYDTYIFSEMQEWELVIYHGGFLSPQKKKLFEMLNLEMHQDCDVFFWADIDLGGFQMYEHLTRIIPRVRPMRMTGQDVAVYHHQGLPRPAEYLQNLQDSHFNQAGSPFEDAIRKILEYGVTIEQEAFL